MILLDIIKFNKIENVILKCELIFLLIENIVKYQSFFILYYENKNFNNEVVVFIRFRFCFDFQGKEFFIKLWKFN